MKQLPFSVWLLAAAFALSSSMAPVVVFLGGLIGSRIAPESTLATLPVAMFIVGTALGVVPVTYAMHRIGRRWVMLAGVVVAAGACLLATYAVLMASFTLFCLGTLLIGCCHAIVQQYRFAAMEKVPGILMPAAASCILLGGILAAFMGPEVAVLGKDWFAAEYAGSFAALVGLLLVAFLLLLGYENVPLGVENRTGEPRPLVKIARQPVFWVAILAAMIGSGLMSLIMTATPVSMHEMDGHDLTHTKWVIQGHVAAMYVPSLITAWLVGRVGISGMMLLGLLAYFACIILALTGNTFPHYGLALILLGVGWNFLFIGGTTLLPESYRANERFKVQAVNDFSVFTTQAIASLGSGWLIYRYGWHLVLQIGVPLLFLQIAVMWYWMRSKRFTQQEMGSG